MPKNNKKSNNKIKNLMRKAKRESGYDKEVNKEMIVLIDPSSHYFLPSLGKGKRLTIHSNTVTTDNAELLHSLF